MKKTHGFFDLHVFGKNISPKVAVIVGAFNFLLAGGILKFPLEVLFFLGLFWMYKDWRKSPNRERNKR